MSVNALGRMRPDSDRAVWWSALFGSLEVPLRSSVSYLSRTAGGAYEVYYQVDISCMTWDQITGICQLMAMKFKQPLELVVKKIRSSHGVPIRASELESVEAFDAPTQESADVPVP